MPKLVRMYITQTAIGFLIAAGFVALLLSANVANLWHLVTHTSAGPLAVFLLWVFNGIVFGGVQFGIAIMRLEEKPSRPGSGNKAKLPVSSSVNSVVPVPVRADTRQIRS